MRLAPISVEDFTRIYDPSAGQTRGYAWYVNDHTFVRGEDGTWHLFGITQQNPFRPFEEVFLTHVTAPDVMGPWTKQADVMHIDADAGESVIWAPHVIRAGGKWQMFYCGGDEDPKRFRINLATSDDLWTWTRSEANPLLQDGYEARDPMVLWIGEQWVMYYTANTAPEGGQHVVAAVTSRDLVHWGDKRVVFASSRSGTGGGPTESPFVVARGDHYLLFVCTNRRYIETAVYESDDPFAWTEDQRIATIPAHAAEVIETPEGDVYISSCGWGMGGVYLARLTFEG